jgi:hypothetical protein
VHRAEGAEKKADAKAVPRPEQRRHHHEVEASLGGKQHDIEESRHRSRHAHCDRQIERRTGHDEQI